MEKRNNEVSREELEEWFPYGGLGVRQSQLVSAIRADTWTLNENRFRDFQTDDLLETFDGVEFLYVRYGPLSKHILIIKMMHLNNVIILK